MTRLISVFTILFFIAVSHYAHANEIKITRPKATNGAKDPNVKVIKDDDKNKKKESIKISVEDFKEFSEKTLDDRVVQFRRGSVYYTMVPLKDLWLTPERKEAFEVAQTFGDKLMKVWLKKTLNMRYGEGSEIIQSEINKLTSAQIRELLKAGSQNSDMPSAREIVEASDDAREAVKALKDRAKFFVEFDELINSFDQNQEEIFDQGGFSSAKAKIIPSALFFVASFKVPTQVLDVLKNSKYLTGIGILLKGSINFTVSVRPWKVVATNLDTGKKTESWYLESASQAWLLKDFKSNRANVSGPLRLGAGVLWGDFNRMADIEGFVTGYSKGFNVKKTSLSDILPIPSYTNIKIGTISAAAETLTQGMDISNFIKNGYFMMTRQYGFQAPLGKSGNWDVGGVFNLASLTDRVPLNQDTLDELLEVVAKEVPGAEIIVRDDQIEILVPEEKTPNTQQKKETLPKQVDPSLLKD